MKGIDSLYIQYMVEVFAIRSLALPQQIYTDDDRTYIQSTSRLCYLALPS